MSSAHRWHDRRESRRRERIRRRGGSGRGPVAVQRAASGVVGVVDEVRSRATRAVRGDRPLVLMLVGAVALGIVLLSGPAQSYLDGRARVQSLQAKAAALDEENTQLERRADDLRDPLNIELLAREQQGFVRPGEVPYTLVPPEVERPRITAPRSRPDAGPSPWYQRVWETLHEWLG